jgi:hypothetical protein
MQFFNFFVTIKNLDELLYSTYHKSNLRSRIFSFPYNKSDDYRNQLRNGVESFFAKLQIHLFQSSEFTSINNL